MHHVRYADCRGSGWIGALGALLLAAGLAALVTGLAACSSLGRVPTLVPTLALPTPRPSKTPPTEAQEVPRITLPFTASTQVVAYDLDPTTGQMVEAHRLSSVATQDSQRLWAISGDAFVEYRPVGREGNANDGTQELVAHKIITHTYDEIGRRVGWTVTWPRGPTATQRLVFLYEGLVAVGERLEVGELVTTTYYPWATRDRNTTVDSVELGVQAPISDVTRYDDRCQATAEMDCETLLARVIASEASVGNAEEQRAVAWTFRNRLDRGLSLYSYARDQVPNREWYRELAREVLTAPPERDVTKGATHFFSPRSMPLQGQEARCKGSGGIYDCDGGLVVVEGLDLPAYAPYWHLLYEWLPVEGIRKTHFLFYRIPPIRPRVGS